MKLIIPIILIVGFIALIVFAGKFILTLISGVFNTFLGIFAILLLIVIVIWMFAYAKKH